MPVQTPAAPREMAPARWRPGRDAAPRDHRCPRLLRDLDHLGHDREGADLAGVARGVVALGDHGIDAGLDLGLGLPRLAHQAPDQDALLVGALEHEVRVAEPRGQHRDLVLEHHLELLLGGLLVQPAEVPVVGIVAPLRDVVALLHVLDELELLARDLRAELVDRSGIRHRGGKDEVDAEGLASHLLAHPADVGVDDVRRMHCVCPSTAKPPALITAAATSLQWVKAMMGYSIPSWSQSLVCRGFLRNALSPQCCTVSGIGPGYGGLTLPESKPKIRPGAGSDRVARETRSGRPRRKPMATRSARREEGFRRRSAPTGSPSATVAAPSRAPALRAARISKAASRATILT